MIHNSRLILEDGTQFKGKSFGAEKSTAGEVVFTTGMVGYDLSLTDPSYSGQILTFTYPLIGNWGVPPKDFWESEKIQVSGLIISDLTAAPSHWQSGKTLDNWLKEEGIPGIYDIDTRALTQKLREKGVMLGKIITDDNDIAFWDPNAENLVADVSPKGVVKHESRIMNHELRKNRNSEFLIQNSNLKIALLNCGAKRNILRNLLDRGATVVYELPWNYDPFENNLPIDGLVISNGPGDPKMAKDSISIIKKALNKKIPTFGICLGNQLLALAAGGDTYKLKFGHRAQNQPTIITQTGFVNSTQTRFVQDKRCYITTQNHGFAVDEKKLPKGFKRWFSNANDNTNEGIIHEKLPFSSVQFHPENNPGPKDTEWLFDYFFKRIHNS